MHEPHPKNPLRAFKPVIYQYDTAMAHTWYAHATDGKVPACVLGNRPLHYLHGLIPMY